MFSLIEDDEEGGGGGGRGGNAKMEPNQEFAGLLSGYECFHQETHAPGGLAVLRHIFHA